MGFEDFIDNIKNSAENLKDSLEETAENLKMNVENFVEEKKEQNENLDGSILDYALGKEISKPDSIAKTILPLLPLPKEIIAGELLQSFFAKKVEPDVGSIVMCKIFGNLAEHSGVYVGNGKFVELAGNGQIRKVTEKFFLSDGISRTGLKIYVACDRFDNSLSSCEVAEKAEKMVGKRREYNILLDNCHQFTAGCITGNFDNSVNFFWMLWGLIKDELNFGEGIRWNICDI